MANKQAIFRNKAANKKKQAASPDKSTALSNNKAHKPTKDAYTGKHAQFLRMETYSKEQSKNLTGKKPGSAQTTHAILQEVAREAEYSKHVDPSKTKVNPPLLIFDGLSSEPTKDPKIWAERMESYIDTRYQKGIKSYEKKIRGKNEFQTIKTKVPPTQSILLAGVLSLPEGKSKKEIVSWARDSIAWLKAKYPNGELKGVVYHRDEECPHIHFYAIPNRDDCDAAYLHDGYKAKKEAHISHKMGVIKEKPVYNKIYKAAMKELQSDYYNKVAKNHDLLRRAKKGRGRIPLPDYKAKKWYERRLQAIEAQHKEALDDIQKDIRILRRQMKSLQDKLEKDVPNPLHITKIKGLINSMAQRESNLRLTEIKVKLEADKNRRITDITNKSIQDQLKKNGSWSAKFKNLGKEHQEEINKLNNENIALYDINNSLQEKLDRFNEGFNTEAEAMAYNRLGYEIKTIEDKVYGNDWKENRINNSLISNIMRGTPVSSEDMAYIIEKAVQKFLDSFKKAALDRKMAQLEEQRRQIQTYNNEAMKIEDFGLD